MQPTVIHALEIKCEVCCGCKNPLKLCDGYNKDSWKLSIPRSQAFEWAFDLRQLPSPLVWWAVTCPVSRFDINELGNKAGSAASFSPIMTFLRADIMSWHSVARSAHEGARSPSPGHWKWTCTRYLMAFPVGSMNLLQASRGQFTNWTAISKQSWQWDPWTATRAILGSWVHLQSTLKHWNFAALDGATLSTSIYTAAWSVEVPWINTYYYMSTCVNDMSMDMDNDMYNIYIYMHVRYFMDIWVYGCMDILIWICIWM